MSVLDLQVFRRVTCGVRYNVHTLRAYPEFRGTESGTLHNRILSESKILEGVTVPERDEHKVELHTLQTDLTVHWSPEPILGAMKAAGYRPAVYAELVAYAGKYGKDDPPYTRIVALGTTMEIEVGIEIIRVVETSPMFEYVGREDPLLMLQPLPREFPKHVDVRFLAVPLG